jgi:hypothetical protein
MNEVEIHVVIDDSDVDPALAALKHKFSSWSAGFQAVNLINFNSGQVDSQLSMLKAKLQSHRIADLLDVNLNPGQIDSQLLYLRRKIEAHKIGDLLDINLNVAQVESQIAAIQAAINGIDGTIPITLDPRSLGGAHGGMNTDCCDAIVRAINANGDLLSHDLSDLRQVTANGFDSLIRNLNNNFDMLSHDLVILSGRGGGGAGPPGEMRPGFGGGRGGWGFWGGLLGFLGGTTFAGIAGWHIALDLLLETLVAVISAMAAFAAGALALAPTMHDLYTQTQSVNTVNSVLGDQIPTLGADFRSMSESILTAGRGIELYGGAILLAQKNTGMFTSVGNRVVGLFDTWMAKLNLWSGNTGVFNKLLSDGIGFLNQFAQIAGYLGEALGHILAAMPGIAHYLMDVAVAAAHVVEWITKIPTPLLTLIIGLHGVYIWGRVAAGGLLLLGNALGIVSAKTLTAYRNMTLLGLLRQPLAIPVIMFAAIAGSLAYMLAEANHAQKAFQSLFTTMEVHLSTLPANEAFIQLAQDIAIVQEKIDHLTLGGVDKMFGPSNFSAASFQGGFQKIGFAIESAWGHMVNAITAPGHGGDPVKVLSDLGDAFKSLVTSGGADSTAFARDLAGANAEINKFVGSGRNMLAEVGKLQLMGFTFTQAFGIMDLAGVKWNDTATIMAEKVKMLLAGYAALSIQGGILANSVNAVNFASLQQQSKVSQLTGAWSAFFTTLSGGETGFVTFAQSILTLDKAVVQVHGHMMNLGGASLTARQDFLTAAQAAQTELNNLTMMASAAGLGAKGTQDLSQATKDMVARLLPAAQHSHALTAILYGLAQQGGYRAADSFKSLSRWADNVKHPLKNLDDITAQLTVGMGNLTTDVKNLSTALGQDLTKAASEAIFMASGGQKIFNSVAESLYHNGTNSKIFHDSLVPLAAQLLITTGSASKAHDQFDAFLIMMGLNKRQADSLWQSVERLGAAMANLKSKAISLTEKGLGTFSIQQVSSLSKPGGKLSGPGGVAAGGLIRHGTTGTADDVLLWGSKGEYMMKQKAVKKYGTNFMDMVNAGQFASGGYVGNVAGLVPFTNRFVSSFQTAETDAMKSAMSSALHAAINQALAQARAAASFGGHGVSPHGSLQTYARNLVAAMWGLGQWPAFADIVARESGWNVFATNPSSGAYGIPQALPGSKMASAGADWRTNGFTQLRWMVGYIRSRWGTPGNADANEVAHHWYGKGLDGIVRKRTLIGVGDMGPERVKVTPVGKESTGPTQLEVIPGGSGIFEQFMAEFLKKFVRIRGGGDPQSAFRGYR